MKQLEDLSYIDVRDLLESTGIKNISESGGEISFSCPSEEHFHGDHSPSARMNARTTAWICHGCGRRGNGITFLAWHRNLPETVARRLLEERYGGGSISVNAGSLLEEIERIQNPPKIEEEIRILPTEGWVDKFKVNWAKESLSSGESPAANYMLRERNFDYEILENWDIGYDHITKRITIPIRDHLGKLVGFKGRDIQDSPFRPKYMILGDRNKENRNWGFDPYQKSKYVFGLEHIYRSGKTRAVMVEGELNAIAMEQHGYAAIAIAGSEFSETQCDLIKNYLNEVWLYLDNDKSGEKGTQRVVEMLSPFVAIRAVTNAPGDAADCDTETVRDLMNNVQPILSLQVQNLV